MKTKKWIVLKCDQKKAELVANKYNISPLVASIILKRGMETDEEISKYLNKDESCFYDPFLMSDMRKAVDYITTAIQKKKKIAVYGDYDVDGITSTYIVYDYLKSIGSDVVYYIPDRADEGYGVNKNAVEYLKNEGVDLIITVDVGITANNEVLYASEIGIDMIITDHHTPKDTLPEAVAVINPKIEGNQYPNKELAGVGVAYKLVYALSGCNKDVIKKYSAAASIGTIADMVPLKDENRFIAYCGLNELKSTTNIGLNALIDISGIEKSQISSSNISFALAPRLNAAGRIATATTSVDLFLEKNKDRAIQLALELENANKIRQTQERNIIEEAEELIQKHELYKDNVIIVAQKNWHHGVIGIVSSKLTEKYYKPSAVISINDDGSAKASGRSISGFNLFHALSVCSDYLDKFGGHELAAGFSLKEKNIDVFRKRINEYSKSIMTDDMLTPKITIDEIIDTNDISCHTAEEIKLLEPFGIGNRTPVFGIKNTIVSSIRKHKSGKHIFFTLEKNRKKFEAPAFNADKNVTMICEGEEISAAGCLNINTFRGIDSTQFVIKDIHSIYKPLINDEFLRLVFIVTKDYVSRSIFRFKLSDLAEKISSESCMPSIANVKIAYKIFNELDLVCSQIESDGVTIKRGKNFYSKCSLNDSETYNKYMYSAYSYIKE